MENEYIKVMELIKESCDNQKFEGRKSMIVWRLTPQRACRPGWQRCGGSDGVRNFYPGAGGRELQAGGHGGGEGRPARTSAVMAGDCTDGSCLAGIGPSSPA